MDGIAIIFIHLVHEHKIFMRMYTAYRLVYSTSLHCRKRELIGNHFISGCMYVCMYYGYELSRVKIHYAFLALFLY